MLPIALASCLAAGAPVRATPSAVRPGLWEVDGETIFSGPNADSPAARLAKAFSKAVKHTECVTPERAARGPAAVVYFDDDPNCAIQDQHMEGGELVFTRVCRANGKAGPPDSVRISAKPDEIQARTDARMADGLEMQTRGTWRRIGDCPAR